MIVVLMESMSAKYLDENQPEGMPEITPNLSRLSREGLFFSNAYATGTRSVRGIEAVTLSVPPLPGMSIVRRQKNENLFNIGSVFAEKGYDNKWIYGGYGYFDNMNYFSAITVFRLLTARYGTRTRLLLPMPGGRRTKTLLPRLFAKRTSPMRRASRF